MKILIADRLAPEGAEFLRQNGQCEVTEQTGLEGPDLIDALRLHDGVVVRSAVQITADVLEACQNGSPCRLRGIARAGVGVDNIDLPTATKYGIVVMNSAAASTITTAEQAFALMIGLARNLGPAHMTMARGGWDRKKFVGTQLHGKTLGVVGMGRIGQTMASRALAFGMKVIGFDPYYNAETALDGQVRMAGSFEEIIEQIDIVTFHVPKNDATSGMLSKAQFAKARPGLLVVNAARGGIVDENDLLEAIESGQCGGAALDVYTQEPPPEDSPLRNHPKILTAPHLGASTVEAQEAVAIDACKALYNYLAGNGVEGAVNVGKLQLDLTDRQQQFVDLASRMTQLIGAVTTNVKLQGVTFKVSGDALAGRADTIARHALSDLLRAHLDQPVNVINAGLVAEERNLDTRTIIDRDTGVDRLSIELHGADGSHRVDGAIYQDGHPRVTHLDGYAMDMVPEGHMVLLTNEDEPGRIGVVGQLFGDSEVNIAEMVIGRKPTSDRGNVAMMILKVDAEPTESVMEKLRKSKGILSASHLQLEG